MSEYDTRQMSVILVRMEKKLDALETQFVHKVELSALRKDVEELQESNRWLLRTAVGALALAILDPVLRVFGGS
ncbi:hypothetical protein [Rothia sp. ZJ1223]|uniref:hypothetical protein n=1 Tax=Rothia sp. ZJ1223 TaxID=2811098 RepID=UPI001957CE45|nr:hypothetical protein [Rothia sp. ZJ1223]MBM7052210.1 hypothetical protein [Rothia sp. ZJ1223]